MRVSGNCWKAAQILRLTGHDFDWVESDGNSGATRTPESLRIEPVGKVPALVLDEGGVPVESNAVLPHFAEGSSWLPPPGVTRTRMHEWLFFEQYSHEPGIAVARNIVTWRREAHFRSTFDSNGIDRALKLFDPERDSRPLPVPIRAIALYPDRLA
jgi:glutathione S-transferase